MFEKVFVFLFLENRRREEPLKKVHRSQIFGQTIINTVTQGAALAATQGLRLFWAVGGDFNAGEVDAKLGLKNCPRIAGDYSMAISASLGRRDFIVMQGMGSRQVVPPVHIQAWDKQHTAVFCEGSPWDAQIFAPAEDKFAKQAEDLQEKIALLAEVQEIIDDEETEEAKESGDTGGAASSASLALTQGDEGPPPPTKSSAILVLTQGDEGPPPPTKSSASLALTQGDEGPPPPPAGAPSADRVTPPPLPPVATAPSPPESWSFSRKRAHFEAVPTKDEPPPKCPTPPKSDEHEVEDDVADYSPDHVDDIEALASTQGGDDIEEEEEEDAPPQILPNIRFVEKVGNVYRFSLELNREYLTGGRWEGEALASTQGGAYGGSPRLMGRGRGGSAEGGRGNPCQVCSSSAPGCWTGRTCQPMRCCQWLYKGKGSICSSKRGQSPQKATRGVLLSSPCFNAGLARDMTHTICLGRIRISRVHVIHITILQFYMKIV